MVFVFGNMGTVIMATPHEVVEKEMHAGHTDARDSACAGNWRSRPRGLAGTTHTASLHDVLSCGPCPNVTPEPERRH